MARLILTSYEIVTPESAEQGDADDRGWIDEEGTPRTVDEAKRLLKGHEPSSSHFHPGLWYSRYDYSTDYQTGAVESRAYHLEGFSEREERWIFEHVTGRKGLN